MEMLLAAHAKAAMRDSASTVALKIAFKGSGDFGKAVCAALSTFGLAHGPVEAAQRLIFGVYPMDEFHAILRRGKKAPGWGCSFVKGKPDPLWADLAPYFDDRLSSITTALHAQGKMVYPNAAAYTACVANENLIPPETALGLVIKGRIRTWMDICESL